MFNSYFYQFVLLLFCYLFSPPPRRAFSARAACYSFPSCCRAAAVRLLPSILLYLYAAPVLLPRLPACLPATCLLYLPACLPACFFSTPHHPRSPALPAAAPRRARTSSSCAPAPSPAPPRRAAPASPAPPPPPPPWWWMMVPCHGGGGVRMVPAHRPGRSFGAGLRRMCHDVLPSSPVRPAPVPARPCLRDSFHAGRSGRSIAARRTHRAHP